MAESDGKDLDDQWVTSVFVVMYEFKELDIDVVRRMPASTFMILLDELNKKNEMDREEMKKSGKGGSFR